MDPLIIVGTVIISYLIGAISFSRVAARLLAPGKQIKDYEVRAASTGKTYRLSTVRASSVLDVLGARVAALVTALDILKVVAVVLAFKLAYPGQIYYLLASLAALAGHMWPVYHRFYGGSGFAVALGGLAVVDWLGAIVCPLVGTIFGMLVLREVSAGFLAWSLALIPWMWFRTHSLIFTGYAVAVNLLFLLSLLPQIRQMVHERRTAKTGFPRPGSAPLGG